MPVGERDAKSAAVTFSERVSSTLQKSETALHNVEVVRGREYTAAALPDDLLSRLFSASAHAGRNFRHKLDIYQGRRASLGKRFVFAAVDTNTQEYRC